MEKSTLSYKERDLNIVKIKVLYVIGSLNIGGSENVVMNYCRYIDKKKFQIDFLIFDQEIGGFELEARNLGSTILRIPHPKKGYVQYYKNLKKIFKEQNYDVVHSHTLFNNGIVMKAAADCNIKVRISHSHSTQSGKKESIIFKIYKKVMVKAISKFSTHFFSCGEMAGEYLFGEKLFSKSGTIINNGIYTPKYLYNVKSREYLRDEMNLGGNLVIGHVGRLAKVKNHDFLIDVFKEIHNLNSQVKLLIIGDGDLKKELVKKVKDLELVDSVIFIGPTNEVNELLQVIDVFVFPSLYEGLPLSLIEAQAAGLKCIVSTNVTSEIKITDLVEFVPLELGPQEWAEIILKNSVYKRESKIKEIKNNEYDIVDVIKSLEYVYNFKDFKGDI